MREIKLQTKVLAMLIIMFGMLLILPSASAAVTLVSPAVGTNQSTTMIVNTTLTTGDCNACKNVTIWYNASGGATGTLLTTLTNDTANDVHFYNAAVDISALTDGLTYNFSAKTDNGTTQAWSVGRILTIDNTDPTGTVTVGRAKIGTGNTNDFTWTSADATSGLQTVSVAVATPDSRCSIASSSATSGTTTVTGSQQTGCSGTYTITLTATDYAGNVHTATQTFATEESGKKAGSNTLGGAQKEPTSKQNLIWVGAIIAVIWYVFIRKNK